MSAKNTPAPTGTATPCPELGSGDTPTRPGSEIVPLGANSQNRDTPQIIHVGQRKLVFGEGKYLTLREFLLGEIAGCRTVESLQRFGPLGEYSIILRGLDDRPEEKEEVRQAWKTRRDELTRGGDETGTG